MQIMPTNGRLIYAPARVEVQGRVDGALAVYYQGKLPGYQTSTSRGSSAPGEEYRSKSPEGSRRLVDQSPIAILNLAQTIPGADLLKSILMVLER